MKLSEAGVRFIASFEGYRGTLYNDAAGHCTIGYGHLVHRGPCDGSEPAEFRAGLSEADAFALLRRDVTRFEEAVERLVPIPLAQAQFDALVSFTYNVGIAALERSDLLQRLREGATDKVPGEMARWVKAGGRRLPGLVARRQKEGALFASEQHPEPPRPEPQPQILMRWKTQLDSDATANLTRRDALAAALAMVLDYHGYRVTVNEVVVELGLPGEQGYFILAPLRPVAARWGLEFEWAGAITPEQLAGWIGESRPLIALLDYQRLPENWRYEKGLDANHYVVVVGYENGRVHYLDPLWESELQGRCWLPEDEFFAAWGSTMRVQTPFQALVAPRLDEGGRSLPGLEETLPSIRGDLSLLIHAARREQCLFDIASSPLWWAAQRDGYATALGNELRGALDRVAHSAQLFANAAGEQRLYYAPDHAPDQVAHVDLATDPTVSLNERLDLGELEIEPL